MADFRADMWRARFDVPFFAERFLGVQMHPDQIRFADAAMARYRERPWEARFFDINVSAGNRAGKTLALAIVGFHHALFKVGLRIPETEAEAKRWLTLPWVWFHFGIESEIAALVHRELVMLLSGTHVAQGMRSCPLTDEIPNAASTDTKWNGMWPYIKLSPELGGSEIHFRTTKEQALGSLGRDMNLISFDECGFETRLPFIVNEVLHFRRLGTAGQLMLISTPTAGITDFADLWQLGDPDFPDRRSRSFSMRMSTRSNVGFGLDKTTFESMIADMPPELVAQNIDGYFVQAKEAFFNARTSDRMFVDSLPELQSAKNGHIYAQGVDPALTFDECWSIMLDITDPDHWVGVECGYLRGRKTTDDLIELMTNQYRAYEVNRAGFRSQASMALDATGMGGKMIRERLNEEGVEDIRNIEFGGQTRTKGKRKVIGDLRMIIDSGRLTMPRTGPWLRLRHQLLRYRTDISKPEDDGIMALGCAVQEGLRYGGGAGNAASVPFDSFAYPTGRRYSGLLAR